MGGGLSQGPSQVPGAAQGNLKRIVMGHESHMDQPEGLKGGCRMPAHRTLPQAGPRVHRQESLAWGGGATTCTCAACWPCLPMECERPHYQHKPTTQATGSSS